MATKTKAVKIEQGDEWRSQTHPDKTTTMSTGLLGMLDHFECDANGRLVIGDALQKALFVAARLQERLDAAYGCDLMDVHAGVTASNSALSIYINDHVVYCDQGDGEEDFSVEACWNRYRELALEFAGPFTRTPLENLEYRAITRLKAMRKEGMLGKEAHPAESIFQCLKQIYVEGKDRVEVLRDMDKTDPGISGYYRAFYPQDKDPKECVALQVRGVFWDYFEAVADLKAASEVE